MSTMTVKFTVLGEPQGKGRPRFRTVAGHAQTYTPKETVNYENLIATEYRRQCGDYMFPENAEIDLRIVAYFGIPASKSKKTKEKMRSGLMRPTKKPDVDNIVKIISDALNGVAYLDDKTVVAAQIQKFYSDRPRLVVSVRDVEKENANDIT